MFRTILQRQKKSVVRCVDDRKNKSGTDMRQWRVFAKYAIETSRRSSKHLRRIGKMTTWRKGEMSGANPPVPAAQRRDQNNAKIRNSADAFRDDDSSNFTVDTNILGMLDSSV